MARDDKSSDQQNDDVEEQSSEETQDQADDQDSGVDEGDADEEQDDEEDADDDEADADDDSEKSDDEESDDDDEDEEGEQLIDDKRFNELKDDPKKLLKELNRAATKKFQSLSKARATVEPYAEFIEAYEADPVAATQQLAEELGIKVVKPRAGATAEENAAKLSDRVADAVKKALGEDYADLADKIGVAVYEAGKEMIEESLKPLRDGQNAIINDASSREANAEIKAFAKSHPDWKKHEAAMTKLTKQIRPTEGISPSEYLEMIYTLATAGAKNINGKVGDKVKKTFSKMTRNATRSEGKTRTSSDKNVSKGPGKLPSFEEAAAAAMRGERLD